MPKDNYLWVLLDGRHLPNCPQFLGFNFFFKIAPTCPLHNHLECDHLRLSPPGQGLTAHPPAALPARSGRRDCGFCLPQRGRKEAGFAGQLSLRACLALPTPEEKVQLSCRARREGAAPGPGAGAGAGERRPGAAPSRAEPAAA